MLLQENQHSQDGGSPGLHLGLELSLGQAEPKPSGWGGGVEYLSPSGCVSVLLPGSPMARVFHSREALPCFQLLRGWDIPVSL